MTDLDRSELRSGQKNREAQNDPDRQTIRQSMMKKNAKMRMCIPHFM